jgi:Copper transport outer membrane protein, MctB
VISFRFHLVSLVAVFLALGVGVLTGTTVINQRVVGRLESQTENLEVSRDALRQELAALEAQTEALRQFGEQATLPVLAGRLADSQVVLLTQDGTSEETLGGVRRALEAAGAQVVASLAASGRMAAANEGDRAGLALILGLDPTESSVSLAAEAAAQVANRLARGPDGTDGLERLLSEDFLVVQGPELTETGLRSLGGSGQAFVILAGGPAPSELDPASFLVPLAHNLALAGMPVVAGEPVEEGEDEPPFVTALRDDAEISPLLSTQDNVDQLPGQVGLALALEDLLRGETGHYGVKEGATQLLPDLT